MQHKLKSWTLVLFILISSLGFTACGSETPDELLFGDDFFDISAGRITINQIEGGGADVFIPSDVVENDEGSLAGVTIGIEINGFAVDELINVEEEFSDNLTEVVFFKITGLTGSSEFDVTFSINFPDGSTRVYKGKASTESDNYALFVEEI